MVSNTGKSLSKFPPQLDTSHEEGHRTLSRLTLALAQVPGLHYLSYSQLENLAARLELRTWSDDEGWEIMRKGEQCVGIIISQGPRCFGTYDIPLM